jgi:serine/threonine-protein kinase RsbW
MTHALEKSLDRSLPALAALAAEVQADLTDCGVSKRALFKVQLALEESIRNLIEHATGPMSGPIRVRIEVDRGKIVIDLEDDGQPFDPKSAPPFNPAAPLETRSPRGMGLHLLRSLIDEMNYERLDGRNRLRMVVLT